MDVEKEITEIKAMQHNTRLAQKLFRLRALQMKVKAFEEKFSKQIVSLEKYLEGEADAD